MNKAIYRYDLGDIVAIFLLGFICGFTVSYFCFSSPPSSYGVRDNLGPIGLLKEKRMDLKECSKCKEHKSLLEFNPEPRVKDGLRADCKSCQYAIQNKRYYAEHFKPEAKERAREAYRRGEIQKPLFCERCGSQAKLEKHHPDYTKSLQVKWLCHKCHSQIHHFFNNEELSVIRRAAERNDCYGDDFLILLAIRKAENGRDKLAFGIMDERANTFEKQAGWCAATIVKNRGRWEKAGTPEDFIKWFSVRYCPLDCLNWERNVRFWFRRLKNGCERICGVI